MSFALKLNVLDTVLASLGSSDTFDHQVCLVGRHYLVDGALQYQHGRAHFTCRVQGRAIMVHLRDLVGSTAQETEWVVALKLVRLFSQRTQVADPVARAASSEDAVSRGAKASDREETLVSSDLTGVTLDLPYVLWMLGEASKNSEAASRAARDDSVLDTRRSQFGLDVFVYVTTKWGHISGIGHRIR